MQPIEWDTGLETGDDAVDDQHRGLVRLFNGLIEAETTGERSDVHQALERLTEYVLVHFSAEEALMRTHEYPADKVAAHVSEHDALTQTTRDLVLQYRAGQLTTVGPIVEFLQAWLTEHVERSDRALIEFVKDGA